MPSQGDCRLALPCAKSSPSEGEPGGTVSLSVTLEDDRTVITVEDNGVGLPAERERLTEPYMTTRDKGTGLGLPIVKKIIEEHGGSLELQDAPVFKDCDHKGAEAVIILPKTALEKPKSETKKVA